MEKKGIPNLINNINKKNSNINDENENDKNINNINYNNIDNINENEIQNDDSYLDIPEVKEASLQSEIYIFNEIFTNIKQYY